MRRWTHRRTDSLLHIAKCYQCCS